MSSTIILKNGTSGAPSSLSGGEVAMNRTTGIFYFGDGSNVQELHRFNNISASGHITASGDISASGELYGGKVFDAELTQNGVVFAGTNGRLSTDSDLTFSGDTLTATNVEVGSITSTGILTSAGLKSTTHITSSGNISASGLVQSKQLQLGDTAIATQTADLHVRNVGSVSLILDSHTGNNNQTIAFLNNQEPDFTIGNYFSDGGFQIRSDDKTFITVGADDGDIVAVSGSLNVTGSSGHISASAGGSERFVVRPNLFWFATNTSETVAANSNDGAFPATDTTKIAWTEEVCSHQNVFVFASDTLTIKRAGLYKFTYNVTLGINNGSNRAEGGVALLRTPNGGSIAVVDGSVTSTYNRFVEGGGLASRGTACSTVVVEAAVDDVFQIDFAKICDTTDATKLKTLPEGTSWYVEALN